MVFYLYKIKSPSSKDTLCQVQVTVHVCLKLTMWFNLYFHYLVNISHWKKDVVLHLNKFQSRLPWDVLSQIWLKLIQSLWRKRFLNVVNVFFLILLFSMLLFIWTNLNSLDPRMICAKFGWNRQTSRGWTKAIKDTHLSLRLRFIWLYIHNQSMSDPRSLLTWSWIRPGCMSISYN